ncbi:MAG: prolyl-tRNA synthetase associated domain-containing protein [Clostridiales bacterium]|nr:prolyl-tRNA synthetase associated domain-containing protein [Clostridiales bacterium]
MELQKGRPADTTGRLEREIAVYDLLDRLGIAYERTDHAAADTMEDCYAIDRVLETVICKNLFLCNRQRTSYYLLMMPGKKVFKTKDLSHQIGSARLSFADSDSMEALLHIHPGSVSIMGLMNDTENRVQLLIDKPVLEQETLGCHPCVNTSSLRMRTRDVLDIFLPAVHHTPIIVDLPEEAGEEA